MNTYVYWHSCVYVYIYIYICTHLYEFQCFKLYQFWGDFFPSTVGPRIRSSNLWLPCCQPTKLLPTLLTNELMAGAISSRSSGKWLLDWKIWKGRYIKQQKCWASAWQPRFQWFSSAKLRIISVQRGPGRPLTWNETEDFHSLPP